jgi:hypothetical protein
MPRSALGGVIALVAALIVSLAAPAAAQSSGVVAACDARAGFGPDSKKGELAASLRALAEHAEGTASEPADALLAMFEKQGMQMFEGRKAFRHLGTIDAWYYESCPATKLDVVAEDFTFAGMPGTVPAGRAAVKLTSAASGDDHEIAMARLTPAGETADPDEFLPLPDKKIARYIDFSTTGFVFAEAGESSYGVVELQPGTYVYACFVNEGGKERGTPHWKHGMYGTFEVQ